MADFSYPDIKSIFIVLVVFVAVVSEILKYKVIIELEIYSLNVRPFKKRSRNRGRNEKSFGWMTMYSMNTSEALIALVITMPSFRINQMWFYRELVLSSVVLIQTAWC